MKKLIWLAGVLFGLCFLFQAAHAATSFYEGKALRIIVGYSPGGGFDLYSRLIARHMGKHIPGNPSVIVENMTGAGSLIAANHVYRIAKPDGLTIGNFSGGLFMGQVLKQEGIEFDARKFECVGVPTKDDIIFVFTKKSGITNMEKWMSSKKPVKMGGLEPGSFTPDSATRILREALSLPIQIVSGYKGTAQIRLACETGELDGTCRTMDSMKVDWKKAWTSGEVAVALQATPKEIPELPGVPLAIKFAKSAEARKLIEVGIHDASRYVRSYVLPPGTPKDRVQTIRNAFIETLKDKELRAEADKAQLSLGYVTGEELEKLVSSLFSLDPAWLAKLNRILYD